MARRKKVLDPEQISVLMAIIIRGHLYDAPWQIGILIFGDASHTEAGRKVRDNAKTGLNFIESIFDNVDENGDVRGLNDVLEPQRDLLKRVKDEFLNFQDLKATVWEFLEKKEA
ncbi:MAG: hypothetical protein PHY72_02765 [Candidatus Pacebacteria bacterium]|nr:hypothetical protein [Candidatus Paceibacterota bacterium]